MELGESQFMTYDRRQAHTAAERGFEVLSPGRPTTWFTDPRNGTE
jgi:uncharacterized protein